MIDSFLKPIKTPPILPLKDFERIFRIIHGVLLKEPGDPLKSCLYFGFIGAAILRIHYKLPAQPIVGVAAYRLNDSGDILAFADKENTDPLASGKFHCWVEVNDWFIDFSSPLFTEILATTGSMQRCGRKMFQKRLIEASGSIAELNATSQFYCLPTEPKLSRLPKSFLRNR